MVTLKAWTSFVLLSKPGLYEIGCENDVVGILDQPSDEDGWIAVVVCTSERLCGKFGFVNPRWFIAHTRNLI